MVGATVTLYDASGTTPQGPTATTNANGEYYFSTATNPAVVPGAQLVIGVSPTVSVDNGYTVGAGTTLSLTTKSGSSDSLGSDADRTTGKSVAFTVAGPGANDHSWDFGYVRPIIDLQVAKTLLTAGVVNPGSSVQFGVTAKNNGPNATTQAFTVVDRLPAGLTPTSASGAGFSCAAPVGQSITCTQSPFAALAAGAFAGTITVSATVDSGATGVLKNVAKVVPGAGEIVETVPLGSTDSGYETGDPTVGSNNDASASVTVTPPGVTTTAIAATTTTTIAATTTTTIAATTTTTIAATTPGVPIPLVTTTTKPATTAPSSPAPTIATPTSAVPPSSVAPVVSIASALASIPTAEAPQVKGQSAEDLGYTGSNSLPLTLAAFALITIGICILRRSRYRATR